ncbi:aspartate/glutamate racemase family protein [Robbsia sp. KACC 23696]|uniref:aspartate/glutamate racemase family protein n=1 Tax=Robbsia sp. KACC 23696 TaxID=3149231 RepID=UPI00325AAC75
MNAIQHSIPTARMDRTLGLLGGMSWESTAIYYRLLNEGMRQRRGGLHSAPLLLSSPDFAPIAAHQTADEWPVLAQQLGDAGAHLARAGAGALLLCSNTMHRLHAEIENRSGLPVLHIADATGEALQQQACRRPALLATRFTMEGAFYRDRLQSRFGIAPLVPDAESRELVHRIIYDELCQGIVRDESRLRYRQVIETLRMQGADSVILGCTEVTMLIGKADTVLPVFDTTALHVDAGIAWLMGVGV